MAEATQQTQQISITTAPKELDCHDTETVAVLGVYTNGHGPCDVRRVTTPSAHVGVQRRKYGENGHYGCSEREWEEMLQQPRFLKKFTPSDPTVDDSTQELTMAAEPQAISTVTLDDGTVL